MKFTKTIFRQKHFGEFRAAISTNFYDTISYKKVLLYRQSAAGIAQTG